MLTALLGVGLLPRPAHPPAAAYAIPETEGISRAITFFERRLGADPTNGLLATALAGRYQQRFQMTADMADIARAEELVRGTFPLTEDRATVWADLASVLLTRHAFAESYAAAGEAVAADSGDAGAWGALYDTALAGGRYAEAERALTRLPQGSVARRVRVAFRLEAQGRAEDAYRALREICRQIESGAPHPLSVAWCRFELGGLGQVALGAVAAARHYEWALEAVPGYRGAIEGLADLARAEGNWAEAERLYRGIAVDAHADLYLRLAEMRAAQGDPGGAGRWERRFLAVATALGAEPLYARELALHWALRPETANRALAVARRDVARRPAVESWDVLAWVYFRRGELNQALAASDRARAWGVPSPTMDYHRGRILSVMARDPGTSRLAERLLDSALDQPDLLEPHVRLEEEKRRG